MGGPVRTEKGTQRRRRVLQAALEVIGRHGVSGTTHRAIADVAGVPLSTTTYYFATLDDLLEAALRLFVEQEVAALGAATAALEGATVGDLADRVATVVTAGDADARRFGAIAQFELYLEAARRPALAGPAAECMAAYEAFAFRALEALGSPRAAELAPLFVALADGLGMQRIVRPEADTGRRLAEALVLLHAATTS